MIPRGKLDIPVSLLFKGIRFCLADILKFKLPAHIPDDTNTLTCLSVRTGINLILKSLQFKPGSEILVTDINIPDMFSIITANQLVAVPISLEKRCLNLSIDQISASITSSTKAILITHLFGSIMDIEAIVELAKKHQLIVIEDCAQAYNGEYIGNPQSDAILFSFGLIKTNTTLTGAVLRFNNAELFQMVHRANQMLPQQSTKVYLNKILKALIIKLITSKPVYTLLYASTRVTGKNFDDLLASFTRGFPGNDVLKKISFRPCNSNLCLIRQRTSVFQFRNMNQRKKTALEVLAYIPDEMKIGNLNTAHTYWVIAIESKDPEKLISRLRHEGIDATARASSLVKLGSSNTKDESELSLDQVVYLPIHPKVSHILKKLHSDPERNLWPHTSQKHNQDIN